MKSDVTLAERSTSLSVPQEFAGFPAGKTRFTSIPNLFFSELLPAIDDLAELKVTLHVLWLVAQKKDYPRYVGRRELLADEVLMRGLGGQGSSPAETLAAGLERAAARGTLLRVVTQRDEEQDEWYFVNTDHGRRAVDRLRGGELRLGVTVVPESASVEVERPNIFTLYEQNIGVLGPVIADQLKDAEKSYPPEWIADAFRIAVEQNVRKWAYVRAILDRWATEGRDDAQRQQDYKEDGRRYIEGKYADYIQH